MLSVLLQDVVDVAPEPVVDDTFSPIVVVLMSAFVVAVVVFMIAAAWKVFTKAGEPGWFSLIPILNTYTVIKIAGRPGWWLILTFVPVVNVVIMVIVIVDLATAFGKGVGFALGLMLLSPIFIAILGWGSSRYVGPQGPLAVRAAAPGAR